MSQEDRMTLHEMVSKLLGPVEAIGDSRVDAIREKNLGATINLVDRLITDISRAAVTKSRGEASMASIGKKAQAFLVDLREALPESS